MTSSKLQEYLNSLKDESDPKKQYKAVDNLRHVGLAYVWQHVEPGGERSEREGERQGMELSYEVYLDILFNWLAGLTSETNNVWQTELWPIVTQAWAKKKEKKKESLRRILDERKKSGDNSELVSPSWDDKFFASRFQNTLLDIKLVQLRFLLLRQKQIDVPYGTEARIAKMLSDVFTTVFVGTESEFKKLTTPKFQYPHLSESENSKMLQTVLISDLRFFLRSTLQLLEVFERESAKALYSETGGMGFPIIMQQHNDHHNDYKETAERTFSKRSALKTVYEGMMDTATENFNLKAKIDILFPKDARFAQKDDLSVLAQKDVSVHTPTLFSDKTLDGLMARLSLAQTGQVHDVPESVTLPETIRTDEAVPTSDWIAHKFKDDVLAKLPSIKSEISHGQKTPPNDIADLKKQTRLLMEKFLDDISSSNSHDPRAILQDEHALMALVDSVGIIDGTALNLMGLKRFETESVVAEAETELGEWMEAMKKVLNCADKYSIFNYQYSIGSFLFTFSFLTFEKVT